MHECSGLINDHLTKRAGTALLDRTCLSSLLLSRSQVGHPSGVAAVGAIDVHCPFHPWSCCGCLSVSTSGVDVVVASGWFLSCGLRQPNSGSYSLSAYSVQFLLRISPVPTQIPVLALVRLDCESNIKSKVGRFLLRCWLKAEQMCEKWR